MNSSTGFGVYRYDNTFFKYEGQWKNGLKHGMEVAMDTADTFFCYVVDILVTHPGPPM